MSFIYAVLVSSGHGHKLPQSRGLNTPGLCQRSAWRFLLEAPWESVSHLSPASGAADHPWVPGVWTHQSSLQRGLSHGLVLCVSVSECSFSCEDTTHWFWAHSSPLRPHLNLITSAETLYPNRATFTGAGTWGRTSVVFG